MLTHSSNTESDTLVTDLKSNPRFLLAPWQKHILDVLKCGIIQDDTTIADFVIQPESWRFRTAPSQRRVALQTLP